MRILFLAQRVPYPPNRGDKIATYHYVRHLARRHDVSVACLADGPADLRNVDGLRPLVRAIDAVVCSPVRRRVRALAALAGSRPLTVAYFDEPELRARVGARLAAERFDVALVYGSGVAQYVEHVHGLPRVIQFSDLDSLKWEQYAASVRPPRRWVYHIEARRLAAYERRLAETFDRSLVCADREADEFRRRIPGVPVEVVRNGVDLDRFRPAAGKREPTQILFTGVMDYLPNVDGVAWFCRDVLPRVRSRVPAATFTICGSAPTPDVRALGRLPGVTVTGAVPAVEPYLARAGLAVIPVRIARGVQNKLLEAMAAGLPTVATTAASAGVVAVDGRDLVVADDPVEFADAVVRLLEDGRTRERMGDSARAAVEAGYAWERTLRRLEETLEQAARAGNSARLNRADGADPQNEHCLPPATHWGKGRGAGLVRRGLLSGLAIVLTAAVAFGIWILVTSYRYGVPIGTAARGSLNQAITAALEVGLAVYDPCEVRAARLAPVGDGDIGAEWVRIDTLLNPGRSLTTRSGSRLAAEAVRNEQIVRSRFEFRYQPFDEPRLHELSRKYDLEKIMVDAPTEFEGMVRLRGWCRDRFGRHEFQPKMANFDSLTILDRDLHSQAPFDPNRDLDPCKLFPFLYVQCLLSVGHQARPISAQHGWVEVWSNEYGKWAVMDAELDHHFEKNGIPQSSLELLKEAAHGPPYSVRLVHGPGQRRENPSMVHMHRSEVTPEIALPWFNDNLTLVSLRNDWMTNHYFRGHPARGEDSSLIYINPYTDARIGFGQRLRPHTRDKNDLYWTLNQTEIYARPLAGETWPLAFRTVTPNFAYYEVFVDDGRPLRVDSPKFDWPLHPGTNALSVRSVNQFGIRGIESFVRVNVAAGGHPASPATAHDTALPVAAWRHE